MNHALSPHLLTYGPWDAASHLPLPLGGPDTFHGRELGFRGGDVRPSR